MAKNVQTSSEWRRRAYGTKNPKATQRRLTAIVAGACSKLAATPAAKNTHAAAKSARIRMLPEGGADLRFLDGSIGFKISIIL
jgi:hypothetical protein